MFEKIIKSLDKLNKKYFNSNLLFALILTFTLIIFSSCARIKMPSGGEKDTKPPKMVKSYPKINSVNFKENKIEIIFDEYIVLDNATGKLILSPPLKNKPKISSKLKTLYIKNLDSMQENTTYIFDLGDAITDFTEGNRLNHFSFAVSTGEIIDTMIYTGRVLNAYTLKPEANKYVGLYKDISVENVRKSLPDYITRTDSNGRYFFEAVKQDNYSVVAFEDLNQNMIFDLKNEGYAVKRNISLAVDTSFGKKPLPILDTLLFSEGFDTVLNIVSKKLENDRTLKIITSTPVSKGFAIQFLSPSICKEDTLLRFNKTFDTINVYNISPDTFDTINIIITDKNAFEDKSEIYYSVKKIKKDNKVHHFNLAFNQDTLKFSDSLQIILPYLFNSKNELPLNAFLYQADDTTNITFQQMPQNPFVLYSNAKLKQETEYTLYVDRDILTDFRGYKNDSLKVKFFVDSEDDYGRIIFSIKDSSISKQNLIISLFDVSGNKISEDKYSTTLGDKVVFENLKPDRYKIRIIFDKNNNKHWDVGSFDNQIEPEKVIYFPKTLMVRKGWDTVEEYNIKL